MDFQELIFDFRKSCNEIGQKHFGPYVKNKVFLSTEFRMRIA